LEKRVLILALLHILVIQMILFLSILMKCFLILLKIFWQNLFL